MLVNHSTKEERRAHHSEKSSCETQDRGIVAVWGSPMKAQGISLFFLYSDLKKRLLEVTSEQYRVESGPYKDVPQTVLKRGSWV